MVIDFDQIPLNRGYADAKNIRKRGEKPIELLPARDSFPAEISVMILALNEERNIAFAIESVSGSNDVVVVDSGSTDDTIALALRGGAKVVEHAFETSAKQRQWALESIEWRNRWVWVLDADEWVTTALARELDTVLSETDLSAAWVRHRLIMWNTWVRRAALYPTWTMRLLRLGEVTYEERSINAHPVARGRAVRLRADLMHQDRKSLSDRLQKYEKVARLEAIELVTVQEQGPKALFHASTPRRLAKLVMCFIPLRSLLVATGLILRGGIFEGRAGWYTVEDYFFLHRMVTRYAREIRRQGA